MQILDKYIGQAITSSVGLVLLIFVMLYELFAFVGEAGNIGRGDYTVWAAIQYSLLLIPQHIYELFPLSMLLGTMLGLGKLANSNELVIIRMAGVSLLRIVTSVMKTAFMLMVFAVIIGEGLGPVFHQYASEHRTKALNVKINLNTKYGLWVRDKSTYINVKRVETDGRLKGITLYEFTDNNFIKRQIKASHAVYENNKWSLKVVEETVYKNNSFVINKMEKMNWESLLDLDTVKSISVPNDMLSIWMLIPIWELNDYIEYLKKNGLEFAKYESVYWTKLFSPLNILAMVLLAVPFVFGSVRHISIGRQILFGFLIGLTFNVGSRLIGQVGVVYGVPSILSALLPPLIIIFLSLLAYRRLR